MLTIEYREATVADKPLVYELMVELIKELSSDNNVKEFLAKLEDDVDLALSRDDIVFILAELGDEVIGLARGDILYQDPIFRLRTETRCGYIDQMYVRPKHRRAGVGGGLLSQCERWLRSKGLTHVLLHAAIRAVRFYAARGYQSNREMFKKL